MTNLENPVTIETTRFRQQALTGVIARIRESLDLETIFKTTATEVRHLLNADRVGVFRFDPTSDYEGEFIAEDVEEQWPSAMGMKIRDHCFSDRYTSPETRWRISAIADIELVDLADCYREILLRFQIRANLVAPLLKGKELWGLLCIHQCSGPRNWDGDIEFISQIAEHLEIALQQSEYLKQLQLQAQQLAEAAARERALATTVDKIRQSLDIDTIFQTTTQEVRPLLKAERVAIYRFHPDWSGEFIAESVADGWQPLVGVQPIIADTHLQATQGGRYAHHQTFGVDDIYSVGHTDCHVALLEQFQAQAYAIAPIFQDEKLWGLLAAYQNSSPRHWHEHELDLLAQVGAQMGVALQHHALLMRARYQTEQQKALTGVIARIRQSLDLENIFQTTATEVRQLLKADRVAVFRFQPELDWEGEFVAEDVATGWKSAMTVKISDHCFSEKYSELYQQGRLNAIADIYQETYKDCYLEILAQFQIRANVVAPLLKGKELWGLLCIHQCSGPRNWESSEIEFTSQIAEQLGVALKQEEYLDQVKQQVAQLATLKEREKAAERQKTLAKTVEKIRQSLDLDIIFKTTTQEVRQLLKVERVAIYRFYSDWRGEFVADSIVDDWTPLLKSQPIKSTFLQAGRQGPYPRNETFVPILQGEKLWGLLVAYQNSQPRYWQDEEINLLAQVGVQLGIAIQQAELLEQTQRQKEELTQALKELQQTQAQLIHGEKMAGLGQLVAGVAHEINNPVNFIYGNLTHVTEYSHHLLESLNLYRQHYPDPVAKIQAQAADVDLDYIAADLPKILDSMHIGAERIRSLVLSLRTFSRLDEAQMKSVDIHEGIESTLLILGHLLKAKGERPAIKVVKEYGKLPAVECYPAQLNQVFMNLISNSIDAIEESLLMRHLSPNEHTINKDPQISIRTQLVAEKRVKIQIADNGLGIPEALRAKVFNPFFTTKDIGKGTGLGLSISYQIVVEKHRGQIKCISQEGKGTEFWLEIPVKQSSSQ